MISLHVKARDTKKKPKTLRAKQQLPAVLYGRKEASTPIVVDGHAFEKVFRDAGESTIITLKGVGDDKEALIHEVDVHPVTGIPQHVDFYVIEKGKKLEVDVALEFIGESPAVEDKGAILVKVMHELPIEALPKDLPHEITVDISSLLTFGDQIVVADLDLPEGVTPHIDPAEVVALVNEPKEEEEEEEEEAEIDMDAIEVEGEKKEADETAEGEVSTETPESDEGKKEA